MHVKHVQRKDNFREDDSMVIVLAPEGMQIEGFEGTEILGNAPVIPIGQRRVRVDNALDGCVAIE